jgi:hypothetical protein
MTQQGISIAAVQIGRRVFRFSLENRGKFNGTALEIPLLRQGHPLAQPLEGLS